MRALVADDDAVTLKLLQGILRESGFEVLLTSSGTEAWDRYQAHHASLVITDWEMPGLSGLDLCSRIRRHDTGSYTYIIFLTSRTGRDQLIEALSAGADDFLQKPLHPDELRVRLRVANRILSLEGHLRRANHDLIRMNRRLQKMSRIDP